MVSRFERLGVIVIILVGLVIGCWYLDYTAYDDTYITFRHSYNFATGRGLVFNEGERFLGSSAPGFALFLGLLGIPWPEHIPLIANIIGGLALIASSLALFEFARFHRAPVLGFLAAIFWMTGPLPTNILAGEMLIQLSLILWSFICAAKGRPMLGIALAAIACLVRPDAICAVPVLLAATAWKSRRIPFREIGLLVLIVAPVYLAIWAYYGSPIPGSITAKSHQREMGMWLDFWRGALSTLRNDVVPLSNARWAGPRASADFGVIRVLVWMGLFNVLVFRREWILPMVWAGIVALGLAIANPPPYTWYLIPIFWPFVVWAAAGIDLFIEAVNGAMKLAFGESKPRWSYGALAAGCILLLLPALGNQIVFTYGASIPREEPYIEIAEWLEERMPPGTKVAHFEIGYLAVHAPSLIIIDPLGLVHPGIAAEVAQDNTYAALDLYDPEVVLYQGIFHDKDLERRPNYLSGFRRVASFIRPERNFYDVYVKEGLARSLNLASVTSKRSSQDQESIDSFLARAVNDKMVRDVTFGAAFRMWNFGPVEKHP